MYVLSLVYYIPYYHNVHFIFANFVPFGRIKKIAILLLNPNLTGVGGVGYTWPVRRGYRASAIAAVRGVAFCPTSYSKGHDNRPSGYPRSQLECEDSVGKARRTAGRDARTVGILFFLKPPV